LLKNSRSYAKHHLDNNALPSPNEFRSNMNRMVTWSSKQDVAYHFCCRIYGLATIIHFVEDRRTARRQYHDNSRSYCVNKSEEKTETKLCFISADRRQNRFIPALFQFSFSYADSLKPCPHCHRKRRLSPKTVTVTVAENGDCRRKRRENGDSRRIRRQATVAVFGDSRRLNCRRNRRL